MGEVNGAFRESDDRLLPSGTASDNGRSARAFGLAFVIDHIDGLDLDAVQLLHGGGNLQFGGPGIDFERVPTGFSKKIEETGYSKSLTANKLSEEYTSQYHAVEDTSVVEDNDIQEYIR